MATGRDNNFNLLRVIAALAVLVTHSVALATGNPDAEPLRGRLGLTLGTIAVDVFFVTSGFLVTASLLRSNRLSTFVRARVLRIYPALVVMLVVTVFGMGAFLTQWRISAYLGSGDTWLHFLRNATLVRGVAYDLPGLFLDNPYPRTVNGSLWTLPYEIGMYGAVAALWLAARIAGTSAGRHFRTMVTATAIAATLLVLGAQLRLGEANPTLRLACMFFTGAAMWIWRDRIVLSRTAFMPLLALDIVAALLHRDVFFASYVCTVAYIVLYLAYVPAGRVRRYNRLGDYSYGIYIYAFPVQQCVAALVPGVSVATMLASSLAITIVLAVASWHLVERRALRLRAGPVTRAQPLAPIAAAG